MIFFSQSPSPGEEGQLGFTEMNSLRITLVGGRLLHILYHFVLPYANLEYEQVACSESFEALMEGLQGALSRAPGALYRRQLLAPPTSWCVAPGRGFNTRYRGVSRSLRIDPAANNPGKGHESCGVERPQDLFKKADHQRLFLRRDRDFAAEPEFRQFPKALRQERNLRRQGTLEEELASMQRPPANRTQTFREISVVVRSTSIVGSPPWSTRCPRDSLAIAWWRGSTPASSSFSIEGQ